MRRKSPVSGNHPTLSTTGNGTRPFPAMSIRADRDYRNMILHAMLVSIQSSIDIATEIIAMKGLRRLVSYRDTFGVLAKPGILTRDITGHLSDLTGFGNVLVHTCMGDGPGPGVYRTSP